MDFAQSKMNQELEEALFSWEEQRLFQTRIAKPSLGASRPCPIQHCKEPNKKLRRHEHLHQKK